VFLGVCVCMCDREDGRRLSCGALKLLGDTEGADNR
jgi:hypothetical protein